MKHKISHYSLALGIGALLLLCLLPLGLAAQGSAKNNFYKVWLRSQQQPRVATGYLQQLSDSTLSLCKNRHRANTDLKVYPVEHVQWVKVRKKGRIGRGILWGAAAGLVTGFVIGFIDGDDPPCGNNAWVCLRFNASEKGVIYSVLTVPTGAIIGGVVGSLKTKITIGGSRSGYARQREQLEKYKLRQ